MTLIEIAERVGQREYQASLALGCDTFDALHAHWAAYNGVMMMSHVPTLPQSSTTRIPRCTAGSGGAA